MPSFQVSRTIFVDAPVDRAHAVVRDFKSWPDWSPWLIAEPDAALDFSEDGKSYRWDGKVIGAGAIRITSEDAPNRINYELTFLKPWKSTSTVGFSFHEKDAGTEVTWSMEGSLPWFMFWMKRMMTAWIGADYERGLRMLKDVVEHGSAPTRVEFPGFGGFPGCRYVGIRRECAIADIGESMERTMNELKVSLDRSKIEPAGPPLSICHDWKPTEGRTSYTLAVPVGDGVSKVAAPLSAGEIPACRTYDVRHIGAYRHLGNAWAAGMMHGRAKRFRGRRDLEPFEIYENSPDTPEDRLVTTVHIPTKD